MKKLDVLYPYKHGCWHTVFSHTDVTSSNICKGGLDRIGKSNEMNFKYHSY